MLPQNIFAIFFLESILNNLLSVLLLINQLSPFSLLRIHIPGNPVPDGKYPFMAAILCSSFPSSDSDIRGNVIYSLLGGGSVVTSEYILTSCYVVKMVEENNSSIVYLGHVHLSGKDEQYIFGIKKVIFLIIRKKSNFPIIIIMIIICLLLGNLLQ